MPEIDPTLCSHRVRRSALLTAVCSGLLLGCPGGVEEAPSARDFSILIAVLDACRADRLGVYGYPYPTTPHLDVLAEDPDAAVFRRHYSNAASTKPSTASLFTGLLPHQHGVTRGHARTPKSETLLLYATQFLDPKIRTLAEHLRDAGFETFAVATSYHLVPEYGFAQGFDRYVSVRDTKSDRKRVQMLLELVDAAGERFFGYLHLNACHNPFPERARDPEFMARYGFGYPEASRIAEGVDFTGPAIRFALKRGEVALDDDDVRFLGLVYDARLRRADRQLVQPLLEGLRRSGRYDDTLLVLTADHGEELYEHRGYAHGHAVWEELTHVPLIVKFPKGRRPAGLARDVPAVTSGVDLLPSLLALVGAPIPPGLPGSPALLGDFSEFAFSRASGQWAVVEDGYKLVQATGGPGQLFDLETDRAERFDLAAREPERLARMRALGEAVLAASPADRGEAPLVDQQLEPEAIDALRSLGYIE